MPYEAPQNPDVHVDAVNTAAEANARRILDLLLERGFIRGGVVGEINFACQSCPICHQGLQRHCPSRSVMGILDADGNLIVQRDDWCGLRTELSRELEEGTYILAVSGFSTRAGTYTLS